MGGGCARDPRVVYASASGVLFAPSHPKDWDGRDVITATEFYIPGTEALGWNYRNEVQAELVPDRTNYDVGDTATLVVKTPISGAALVTVEREGVRRAFVTNLVGNAPALSVPILPGDAPNVFVSVVLCPWGRRTARGKARCRSTGSVTASLTSLDRTPAFWLNCIPMRRITGLAKRSAWRRWSPTPPAGRCRRPK